MSANMLTDALRTADACIAAARAALAMATESEGGES